MSRSATSLAVVMMQVQHKTLDYVDWFNNRQLHRMIGDVPSAEFEVAYYDQPNTSGGGVATPLGESL